MIEIAHKVIGDEHSTQMRKLLVTEICELFERKPTLKDKVFNEMRAKHRRSLPRVKDCHDMIAIATEFTTGWKIGDSLLHGYNVYMDATEEAQ